MYYSGVVDSDLDRHRLIDTATAFEIELKIFTPTSFQGSQILELASEQGAFNMPVVMVGDKLLASGKEAWVDMYEHAQANPHVHWEAGDEGDND